MKTTLVITVLAVTAFFYGVTKPLEAALGDSDKIVFGAER